MSLKIRISIMCAFVALYAVWVACIYHSGRENDWVIASAFSVFVLTCLGACVFVGEIKRWMK